MQQTLVLLKPDAVERGLVGAIIMRFEQAGLRLVNCRHVRPSLAEVKEHYADLKSRNAEAFNRTTQYFKGKPFVALILSGPQAIAKVRALTGATDPLAAAAGTIRGDFGSDSLIVAPQEKRSVDNLIHSADSPESAAREIDLWFNKIRT